MRRKGQVGAERAAQGPVAGWRRGLIGRFPTPIPDPLTADLKASDSQIPTPKVAQRSQQGAFEKLRVPVQRWRRSKAARNGVDLAIDLRLALESLFFDEVNNTERGFRLALRAAWYLGAEGDKRTRIFEATQAAYRIGSEAANRGKGYDDMIPGELATAQDVCRMSILRRISDGGKLPNWNMVVLGG